MNIITPNDMSSDGSFKCPQCGEVISPDIENDEEYMITDSSNSDVEIKIRHKCGADITVKLGGVEN